MVIGWAYLSSIVYMITFIIVLVVYLLISNSYLHYKILDVVKEVDVLSDYIFELIYK